MHSGNKRSTKDAKFDLLIFPTGSASARMRAGATGDRGSPGIATFGRSCMLSCSWLRSTVFKDHVERNHSRVNPYSMLCHGPDLDLRCGSSHSTRDLQPQIKLTRAQTRRLPNHGSPLTFLPLSYNLPISMLILGGRTYDAFTAVSAFSTLCVQFAPESTPSKQNPPLAFSVSPSANRTPTPPERYTSITMRAF